MHKSQTPTLITWPWSFTFLSVLAVSFLWPSFPIFPFTLLHSATPSIRNSPRMAITKSAFQATRITPSTFLVKEHNDIFSERPHIYVKVIPSAGTVLVIDTGTGGKSNDNDVEVTSLRQFIETVEVADNDHRPLNEGGKMKYVVVTTHCHYDHILGLEDFADSVILASGHSKAFLSPDRIQEHSLANALNIKIPQYTPKFVPHGHVITSPTHPRTSLNITLLHTPGHTPDSLAIYDVNEMMLFVGDSFYEHDEIIFPSEGSIVKWFESVDYLMTFVTERNEKAQSRRDSRAEEVLVSSGHRTAAQPAMQVLSGTKAFMEDVIQGRESIKGRLKVRGEVNLVYEQAGGRFSLRCPERLIKESRRRI
ncbi:hypothetical protein NP233_g3103 [Leucocoprinus birnbaumii]|uniref:Metallo-beta-lactamase domain-containing protein n=1 Tax=Leucocoprinus birnbaumii TaxID=56174 RepID=A0AAD5VX30_9AGAR|nr:hypothetical protein NP233_g3103 [Leucocoprinus birnbaumii]